MYGVGTLVTTSQWSMPYESPKGFSPHTPFPDFRLPTVALFITFHFCSLRVLYYYSIAFLRLSSSGWFFSTQRDEVVILMGTVIMLIVLYSVYPWAWTSHSRSTRHPGPFPLPIRKIVQQAPSSCKVFGFGQFGDWSHLRRLHPPDTAAVRRDRGRRPIPVRLW